MALTLALQNSGSYSILHKGVPLLEDCYPSIDGRPLRAERVTRPGPNTLCYHTERGKLLLSVAEGERLEIRCRLEEFQGSVHSLSPLGGALCKSPRGFYQTARGMGAPCGYHPVEGWEGPPREGEGVAALGWESGFLSLYALDHRHYRTLFRFGRDSFREGWLFTAEILVEHRAVMEDLPPLFLDFQEDLNAALDGAALAVGAFMNARDAFPPAYHWCSWYYCYSEFDQDILAEYLEGLKTADPGHSLQTVQIDAGYSSSIGDWLTPRERWSRGLEPAVEAIRQAGYTPGIWIGPFMAGNRSRVATEHPDWLLRDREGELLRPFIFDNEPKLWGYRDEEYYVLDTSHPEAMDYLRSVFRAFRAWGIRFFKTDFMLWGFQDSTLVRRHTPGKTSVEYFREVLEMIRQEIGEESYWLGCIAPFFPFVGYCDGMRVGGDVGSRWEGEFSPQNMIRSVYGNSFLNHRFFQTDPDAILLRDFHIRLLPGEIRSLALYAALSGGCVYTSDPLHLIGEDRRKLFSMLQPAGKRRPELPYLQEKREEIVFVHSSPGGDRGMLFFLNPTDRAITQLYTLESLGHPNWRHIADRDDGTPIPLPEGSFPLQIPPHGYRLLLAGESLPRPGDGLWDPVS